MGHTIQYLTPSPPLRPTTPGPDKSPIKSSKDFRTSWLERVLDDGKSIALKETSPVQRGTSLPALENKWLISFASFSYFAFGLQVFLRGSHLLENP